MPNKILILVVIILTPLAVISFKKNETNFNLSEKQNEVTVRLKIVDNNEVINISLEDYIVGVVAAEMPASFEIEALKAQAVAARTYALYKIKNNKEKYDLVSDISDQSYITNEEMQKKWQEDYDKYYKKIKKAVTSTEKEILTYNDEVIISYYFAMSNGYTEDSSYVFGTEPYLNSVISEWDNESIKNFQVVTNISKSEFKEKLGILSTNITINKVNRTPTERVESIIINNMKYSGTEFRKQLNLRSTAFDIVINDDEVIITTYGYGHGVGMSQYGANGMAKDGYDYINILKHYYNDIEITKI